MKFNSTEQRDYNLKAPIKEWDSSNMVIDVEYIQNLPTKITKSYLDKS